MAFKDGGDVHQANVASQGNISTQDISGAAVSGPALVDSVGGAGFLAQTGAQFVGQASQQANIGFAGFGGSDNLEANKAIAV